MHGLTIHYIFECQNCDAIKYLELQEGENWYFPDGFGSYDNDVFCHECLDNVMRRDGLLGE